MLPNKKDLISAILDFYDEVELATNNNQTNQNADVIELSTMEKHFIEIGKQSVFEKSLHSWHNVTKYNGEMQTFDNWLNQYLSDIPSWMSMDTFISIYEEDLRAIYDADVEDAHKRNRKLIENAQAEESDDE